MAQEGHSPNYIKKRLTEIHSQESSGQLPDDLLPLIQIKNHHITYFLRKEVNREYKLKNDSKDNLLAWGEIIREHGFFRFMNFPGLSTADKPLWGCVFMDEWQKRILESNQDLYYLELTHSVSRDFGRRMKDSSVYLCTVVVRDNVIEIDTPGAFLPTNSLKEDPVIQFLEFLRLYSIKSKQFMIDCSVSELNAIKTIYPESNVSILKENILCDMRDRAKSIFNNEATQKEAVYKLSTVFSM